METELAETIRTLLNPETYPDKPSRVEMVQTQMSIVFLTEHEAYKIKKPVNLGYLDYTTLEKRRFFCEQEIILNRRLCPEAYLGVVRITRGRSGIALEGRGVTLEYAVRMLRLPPDRMLAVLMEKDIVTPGMMTDLAQKLADFHSRAETGLHIAAFGRVSAIRRNTEENFRQTEKYIDRTISDRQFRAIKTFTDQFIREKAPLLHRRVYGKHIRDCHGDLHIQHVCFCDDICIFDCIEFNDRFRYSDVASDIAFLAMDMDHYGRADLARSFTRSYTEISGDLRLNDLLKFYKCYRAYIRGKVESFKSDDPYITAAEREQAIEAARSYFDLAESYIRPRPVLFITVGLTGTGKTTLARSLAGRLGLTVISSDIVRKRLTAIPAGEHRFEEMESGIYADDFTRRTYEDLFSEAREILVRGDPVILDASFIRSENRLKARELAVETGAEFFVLECTLDENIARRRLDQRLKDGSISDGRWEIYGPQKKKFEPVREVSPERHFIIDTSRPLNDQIRQIIERTGDLSQ